MKKAVLILLAVLLLAALLCSCKTAAPGISGTMWVELSLDGQYALTNAAGQTLRYFDLLQYDGTMPVEKTHLNGGEAAYSASLCVPRTETLTVEVTDGSLFSASWEAESQFRKIEGSVRKIVLSDKTTSVETAGEAYTLTARMPGDNGNRLLVSTAGDLTLTQKEENLLRGDAEYTCTLKNGNGDIVAEQTIPPVQRRAFRWSAAPCQITGEG